MRNIFKNKIDENEKKQEISSRIYSFDKKKLFKLVEMIFIHSFSNKKKISFFAEESTKLDKKFIFESATRIYMNQKFLSHVYNESASRDRFFEKNFFAC